MGLYLINNIKELCSVLHMRNPHVSLDLTLSNEVAHVLKACIKQLL